MSIHLVNGSKPAQQKPPETSVNVMGAPGGVLIQIARNGVDFHNAGMSIEVAAQTAVNIGNAIEQQQPGFLHGFLAEWLKNVQKPTLRIGIEGLEGELRGRG